MKFPLGTRVLTSLNIYSNTRVKELTVDGGVEEHQYDARTAGITGTVVHFDENTWVYLVEYTEYTPDEYGFVANIRFAAYLENELTEALQLPFEEPAFKFDDSLVRWLNPH